MERSDPPGRWGGSGAPRGVPGEADRGLRFQHRNPTRAGPGAGHVPARQQPGHAPSAPRARLVTAPLAPSPPPRRGPAPNLPWSGLSRDVTAAPPALSLTSPGGG